MTVRGDVGSKTIYYYNSDNEKTEIKGDIRAEIAIVFILIWQLR